MTQRIIEDGNRLLCEARSSLGVRLFAAVIGLSMFMIPVPYVIHAPWGEVSLTILLAVACIVAPTAFGLFVLFIAVTGRTWVEIDGNLRQVRSGWHGLFGTWLSAVPFTAVESVEVVRRTSSEDPDWFQVALRVAGRRRPVSLGVFSSAGEAEPWRRRIAALVGSQADQDAAIRATASPSPTPTSESPTEAPT
ncbi:hypothetical protein [Zavarzinia sp. CC-PAN008]|uniref:hypothetical protein n=1 Tax=Zavarzinia sp. CC-PAN008 TaxID=3243332 RepID=UPI003F74239B